MTINWTTVFAAIGAVTGVLTGGDKLLSWYRDRRSSAERAAALWSMSVSQIAGGDRWHVGRVVYDDKRGPPLRLLEIRATAPRGLRLCDFHRGGSPHDPGDYQIEAGRHRSIEIVTDLNQRTLGGNEFGFIVELPRRPWWRRTTRCRIKVTVVGEERTARRRVRRVTIASQQVSWT